MERSPHDQFFKRSLQELPVARSFLKNHLPNSIKPLIHWGTLNLFESNTVGYGLDIRISDITYKAKMKKELGYFITTFEHKSYPDKWAPFQVFYNMFRLLDTHHRQQQHSEDLPLVYGLLVYNGEKPYNFSTNFYALFGYYKDHARTIFNNPCQLIDFNDIPDKSLQKNAYDSLMIFAMKKVAQENMLDYADKLAELMNAYQENRKNTPAEYIKSVLHFLLTKKSCNSSAKQFTERLGRQLRSDIRGDMMTMAEQFVLEGKLEGKLEGLKQGKEKTLFALIKNMQSMKIPSQQIALITKLPLKKVEDLLDTQTTAE